MIFILTITSLTKEPEQDWERCLDKIFQSMEDLPRGYKFNEEFSDDLFDRCLSNLEEE